MADRNEAADMEHIREAYDLIEQFVRAARCNMRDGGRADIVNGAFVQIESMASGTARLFHWPDLQARALETARRDRALQKTLKKAHRKTPI